MNVHELVLPSDRPSLRARVPGAAIRVVFALVGTLLSLVVYGSDGWLAVGILLSVLAAWMPEYLLGWLVIVFLGFGELGRQAVLSWQLLVLIAGVQLLHVLATLTLGLPWRSWVEPAVFVRPLVRFVAIQVPVQALSVVALLLLAPDAHGHRPLTLAGFAALGTAALAGLALLLFRTGYSD